MNAALVLDHEAQIRLFAFLSVLAACEIWQSVRPLRRDGLQLFRQGRNFTLIAIGTLLLRASLPMFAVQWAVVCQQRGWGLLSALPVAPWLQLLVSMVVLDLAIYAQHWLFHRVRWLWRLHRVHHSDTGFDVSTGVRFHPLELGLSMLIKFAVVALLGAPALAVLAFEILLSAGALFTHADAALPARLDHRLRWLLVTPSMHRIHHSIDRGETDSNFGFHLSIWDRCFGTYRAFARTEESRMPIGLMAFRSAPQQRLHRLLLQPLSSQSNDKVNDHA